MRTRLKISNKKEKSIRQKASGQATLTPAGGQAPMAEHPLLEMQRQYGNRHVQRMLALTKKIDKETEAVPKARGIIQHTGGGGQTLDSGVRAQMESSFGADFSGVRAHTDGNADTLSGQLNARAFNTSKDIFFKQGTYNPGSSKGRTLLAHELTHVVQPSKDKLATKEGEFVQMHPNEDKELHPIIRRLRTILKTTEKKGFPQFKDDELYAFNDIKDKLNRDPRKEKVRYDELDTVLSKCKIPKGKEGAYNNVLDQLKKEIGMKNAVDKYFGRLWSFLNTVKGSYKSSLDIVGRYFELKSLSVGRAFIARIGSEAFEAIKNLPQLKHAELIGESIKIIWDVGTKLNEVGGTTQVPLEMIDAYKDLEKRFQAALDEVEEASISIKTDYGLLQEFAKVSFPEKTGEMRRKAIREFEVETWKELLPKHYRLFYFYMREFAHSKAGLVEHLEAISKRKPWIYYKNIRFAPHGRYGPRWYADTFEMGTGSAYSLWKSRPEKELLNRLFKELAIPRDEVFFQWNFTIIGMTFGQPLKKVP